MYEYCVMHTAYPNEPHRGPWPKQECESWIEEAVADGFKNDVFYVAVRICTPWTPVDESTVGVLNSTHEQDT
jgi:hypothetical protein